MFFKCTKNDLTKTCSISSWMNICDLRNNWLNLYNFARHSWLNPENKIKLTMMLSLISYASDISMDNLIFFKMVAQNYRHFINENPPNIQKYNDINSYFYKKEDVLGILQKCFKHFYKYQLENTFNSLK